MNCILIPSHKQICRPLLYAKIRIKQKMKVQKLNQRKGNIIRHESHVQTGLTKSTGYTFYTAELVVVDRIRLKVYKVI